METEHRPGRLKNAISGLSPAMPVILGYVPVGFAYGMLASNAGLTTLETLLMSVLVFAGSAQLMAVGMFGQGINPVSIIATTFVVNLRHLLMSASLSTHMRGWRGGEVAVFCCELTDETFAVHNLRFERGETKPLPAIAINLVCQASWIAGTILGAAAGSWIEDTRPFALDYALPAMFIALLILQIHSRVHILAALAGGILSMVIWGAGLTQWNVVLATVIGAAIGALIETLQKKKEDEKPASEEGAETW